MTPLDITAILLTKDEERNLPECLAHLVPYVRQIYVVDSFSVDRTVEIAKTHGCLVVQHPWRNYASQFQWALDTLPIRTEWVLRVDADERWSAEGFERLGPLLEDSSISGVSVRMKIMFMGRFLRHGGLYPNNFLRVFRKAGARIEQRWMDEHIKIDGRIVATEIDVVEANYDRQHHLGLWTTKHNAYSTREAADLLILQHRLFPLDTVAGLHGDTTARKRWLKENLYVRTPLFVRPFLYFGYRYVVRAGFLDGIPGFVFHVLQGFWYRFLADAKVYQINLEASRTRKSIRDVMRETYGLDL